MKITRFSNAINWKPELWDALNNADRISEMLDLQNLSSLGEIGHEMFKQSAH